MPEDNVNEDRSRLEVAAQNNYRVTRRILGLILSMSPRRLSATTRTRLGGVPMPREPQLGMPRSKKDRSQSRNSNTEKRGGNYE